MAGTVRIIDDEKDLLASAIDVVIEQGFLTRVDLRNRNDIRQGNIYFCCPRATAQDIRSLLRDHLGLTSNSVELRLMDEFGSHVVGHSREVGMEPPPLDTMLTYEVVTVEPHWQSLFDMLDIGDQDEREKMIDRMLVNRRRQRCTDNHPLAPVVGYDDFGVLPRCNKCRQNIAFLCEPCHFGLCQECHEKDQGRIYTWSRPYEELRVLALDIANSLAWAASLWVVEPVAIRDDIRPLMFFEKKPSWGEAFSVSNTSLEGDNILPRGINLVLRASQSLRRKVAGGDRVAGGILPSLRMLKEIAEESHDDDDDFPGALLPEMKVILADGAIDIVLFDLVLKLVASPGWEKVERILREIDKGLHEMDLPELRSNPDFDAHVDCEVLFMSLVSYEPGEVTYELNIGCSYGELNYRRGEQRHTGRRQEVLG